MFMYFDEAGDFQIPAQTSTHRAAVVVGISICDGSVEAARTRFGAFLARVPDSEREKGEVKGKLLSPDNAVAFCEVLEQIDGLQVTPVILDLSHLAEAGVRDLATQLRERLEFAATQMQHEAARDGWELLGRQVGNLSSPQMLRIFSLANAVRAALEHAILFQSAGDDTSSWHSIRVEVDRVQERQGSREERVFSIMVLAWLAGWSRSHPFTFINEIHTPDHPILKLYGTDQGVDIGPMLRDRIFWVDSSESWGVQMADIAASVVFQAATDLDDHRGAIGRFRHVMRSSPYGPGRGPGLFTPLSEDPSAFAGKYALLNEP